MVVYQGGHVPIPEKAHPIIQQIMNQSFDMEPKNRPEFTEIASLLEKLP